MNAIDPISSQAIQQAVIEKLARFSLDEQKKVLAFVEDLVRREAPRAKFGAIFKEAAKNVPPEAWQEVPTDGAINHDHYLYGAPKRYDQQGNLLLPEQLGQSIKE